MPTYEPIKVCVAIQASRSGLIAFEWRTNGITADFIVPDDEKLALRVTFDRQCIVRLLDEMPLSTEDDLTPTRGLVSDHFAYRLEGAAFAQAQSDAWKTVNAPATHYQFVTGWACMDVLSASVPIFEVVSRS